ncbi:type II toxin-antitoxin system RelE family toxin [Varibaculum massiliense]|uniref:type II toxin-antitoxin system RelE family toxin n=1 Tax=Varibaculum massiliense TaxID=1852372 RepID=UPI002889174E|nr:type II toxin-antitoxin system RelE/ParE family toxin [Varibaculum massiliense]
MVAETSAFSIALSSHTSPSVAYFRNYAGQWRYRIGNYRLICEIDDDCFYIQALAIGHRKEIYR